MKKKLGKKILCMVMMLCLVLVGATMTSFAEGDSSSPVTLDISKGKIVIYPDGYTQNGGDKVLYTGAYVLTGQVDGTGVNDKVDTPLEFYNTGSSLATYNVTFKNFKIISSSNCSAVMFYGKGDITLNASVLDDLTISASNHAPLRDYAEQVKEYGTTINITINFTKPECSKIQLECRTESMATEAENGDTISLAVNNYIISKAYMSNYTSGSSSHDFETVEANAPTCKDTGNWAYIRCKYCGEIYETTDTSGRVEKSLSEMTRAVDPNAHGTMTKTDAVDGTCNTKGVKEYWTCSLCGKEYLDENAATARTAGNMYSDNNATNHSGTVTKTDEVPATCVSTGTVAYWTCSDCKESYLDKDGQISTEKLSDSNKVIATDSDNHTNLVPTAATDETCEADGNVAYWTCEGCGAIFLDADGTRPATLANTVLNKTGHQGSDVYFSNALTHWNACDSCDTTLRLNEAAHEFSDWKVTKKPTANSKGARERVCYVCGYVDKQYLSLAGPIGSAQTGDYDMFIFVYLMLAAMATGALVYRRER